jgi:hypothetical protein
VDLVDIVNRYLEVDATRPIGYHSSAATNVRSGSIVCSIMSSAPFRSRYANRSSVRS